MHYVFRSRAAADLIMMGPAGDQILSLLGREPSPRGIIEVAALPAAIEALEAAVAAERRGQGPDDGDEPAAKEPRVGLAQRAWPMLEMMRRAQAERADIVWGA